MKLKNELDLAYKILSARDTEINQMKKQAKFQAFNQCNEERMLYMNECMKLQNLLKIYGGQTLRKKFRGIQVTQGDQARYTHHVADGKVSAGTKGSNPRDR